MLVVFISKSMTEEDVSAPLLRNPHILLPSPFHLALFASSSLSLSSCSCSSHLLTLRAGLDCCPRAGVIPDSWKVVGSWMAYSLGWSAGLGVVLHQHGAVLLPSSAGSCLHISASCPSSHILTPFELFQVWLSENPPFLSKILCDPGTE